METPAIKPERKKNRSDFKIARLTLDQRDAVRLYCETVSLDEGARWLAEHFNIT